MPVLAREVIQWSGDIGEVRNEGSVEVTEAEEAADVLDAGGGRPLRNALYFDRVHMDRTIADNHTKILHFLFVELAFRRFEEQAQFLEFGEPFVDNGFMFCFCSVGMDHDVVHVDRPFPLIYEFHELIVHHRLKCRGGIRQAEEHDRGFKEAVAGFECCFPFVTLFDVDVVISPLDVELCEPFLSGDTMDEFGDKREGVAIRDGPRIQLSIVLDGSQLSVFLLDEEEATGIGRL